MALLNELRAAVEWMGWYVLPFIFVMSMIVFFHELGHYLVGRWCGVKIDAFSLGFGPELYARVDKYGTRWRLAAFPLGGYVKFHGDANAASAPDIAGMEAMSPSERAQTLAGPAAAQSRGDRRGRADRQLHSRLRHFHRAFHGLWVGSSTPRGSAASKPDRPPSGRDSWRATSSSRSTASRSRRFRTCSRRRC